MGINTCFPQGKSFMSTLGKRKEEASYFQLSLEVNGTFAECIWRWSLWSTWHSLWSIGWCGRWWCHACWGCLWTWRWLQNQKRKIFKQNHLLVYTPKKLLETKTLKKLTTQAHNCIINFIYLCKFAKFQTVISQENEIDYSTCGTHVLSLISCRLAKSRLLSASIVKMCICSWQFCCLQSMYY